MTTDEQRERDMRRTMRMMASRKLTYWSFRFNFIQGKWGKMGPLLLGLAIEFIVIVFVVAPGLIAGHDYVFTLLDIDITTAHILRVFGVLMEVVLTFGHWRNYNGRQA